MRQIIGKDDNKNVYSRVGGNKRVNNKENSEIKWRSECDKKEGKKICKISL